MNYNKVILGGNLTRDPQLSYLPSQTAVVEFGLAVNRKWKDKSGEGKEEVCFVDCKAFGKTAETIQKYLAKGRLVLIEGRLSFRTWDDKNGGKHSKHEVVIESFQFIGDAQQKPAQQPQQAAPEPESDPETSIDDIPF